MLNTDTVSIPGADGGSTVTNGDKNEHAKRMVTNKEENSAESENNTGPANAKEMAALINPTTIPTNMENRNPGRRREYRSRKTGRFRQHQY